VYSLVTNTEKRTVSDLFRRSMDTCFILYFLATRTAMFGAKLPGDLNMLVKNDDVTFFGGLILRHQQIYIYIYTICVYIPTVLFYYHHFLS